MTSDRLIRSAGVSMSQRVSRRSLLGRTATAVAGLGAASAGIVINPEPAIAGHLPCSGELSDTCTNLLGSNNCPSYTCSDGWWLANGPCGSNTHWQDCCTSSSFCNSDLNGCHCHDGHPTCCNNCIYGVNCTGKVRCRRWFC
jgi:hypothetical protein